MKDALKAGMPKPVLKANDTMARTLIWIISAVLFLVIASLSRIRIDWHPGFDPHIFATVNAIVNSMVACTLLAALFAVKKQRFHLHKQLMVAAILLSVLFLLSYVAHHLLTGDTKFGDANHDNVVNFEEKEAVGALRYFYYGLLLTHIPLAAVILPFILFTSYRALTGKYDAHKKLARFTWPVWFYVAVSGVLVYLMIRPYYG